MSAAEFAALVEARPAGRGTWTAKCPAHRDRSPSLSIRAGDDGRVLVLCRAGCALDAILAALNLARRDLFTGPPPTAEQVRRMAQERERRDVEARNRCAEHGAACDRLHRLERVAESLAGRLARLPDGAEGDALAALFHAALGKIRKAETRELELRA
jgi:hypothetical protein